MGCDEQKGRQNPAGSKARLQMRKRAQLGRSRHRKFRRFASEPQFYELHHHDSSFAIVTDTGYVSPMVAGIIQDAEAYLFECNHDTEMLRMGAYPWPLKQRILGDTGHLSNEDGANALMSVIGNRTKQIYLGHLSRENNVKELAHLTVDHMMRDHDFAVDHDFYLHDTDPEKATPLIAL